jgi:hypothetical protein
MLCEMLFAVPQLFAQTPGGPFDRMSAGNQKIARALYEAQKSQLPPGSRLTLDGIAARKRSGEGWGRVFDGMKSEGLVDSRNLGQAVSGYNQRHHVSSAGTVTTAANRTVHGNGVNAGRDMGPKTGTGDHGRGAMSTSQAPVHGDRAVSSGGASHGGGRGK